LKKDEPKKEKSQKNQKKAPRRTIKADAATEEVL
jgi:hypothetical protein